MRRVCVSAISALSIGALSGPAFADPLQMTFSPYAMSQPVYGAQQPAPMQQQYAQQQYAQPQYPVQVQQYQVRQYQGQQYYTPAPSTYLAAPQPAYAPAPQQAYAPAPQQAYAPAPQPVYVAAPQTYAAPARQAYYPASEPYAAPAPQTSPAPARQAFYPASQPYAAAAPQAHASAAAEPAYTGSATQRYATAPASTPAAAPAAQQVASALPPPPPQPPAANGGGFLAAIFGGPTIQAHYYQPPASQQAGYQPAAPAYQTPEPQGSAGPQGFAPSSQGDMASYPVDPKFNKQIVDYRGTESPGTIVIDTPNKFLYLVEDGNKALRYGIGVGRPGFTWSGVKSITAKKEWPDWRPPDDMLARRPDLPRFMPGGIDNPLGARAMYLGSTLYRIHGSNEPWTIGTNVSSGCIRMRNEDVTDLYGRVKVGTRVVVI